MNRQIKSFPIDNFETTKQQLLHWANQYSSCSFLDNHQYASQYNSVECLVGAGAVNEFYPSEKHQSALKSFLKQTNDWIFGHVSYNYKNVLFKTDQKEHINKIGFGDIHFFQPAVVVLLSRKEIEIQAIGSLPKKIYEEITNFNVVAEAAMVAENEKIDFKAKITKEAYLGLIEKIKSHILRGDCYELNFCQEFFAENAHINPLKIYKGLTNISPNPFSCYYKLDDKYLLCASPERYLKKTGNKIISQPIKGTSHRNSADIDLDIGLKEKLYHSAKDRAENVMVVDLVRNDLSKICKEASVSVKELFGIYSFPNVHQMISTIEGEIKDNLDLADILEASFPMGSMTGAPKKRVMELIDEYENNNRGLYSGAVGYISPNKDFDFNVVIRSILYNKPSRYLSYQVGGGITYNSNPEDEYDECILKAAAIRQLFMQ